MKENRVRVWVDPNFRKLLLELRAIEPDKSIVEISKELAKEDKIKELFKDKKRIGKVDTFWKI